MHKPQNFLKLIGENVRYFRRKGGLSQEELAGKAELHSSYISRVERGVENISAESIKRIADALNIEPYLFFVSEFKRAKELMEIEKG